MKSFLQSVANDVLFAVEFLGIVTLIFLLAYLAEKWMQKRQGKMVIFVNYSASSTSISWILSVKVTVSVRTLIS